MKTGERDNHVPLVIETYRRWRFSVFYTWGEHFMGLKRPTYRMLNMPIKALPVRVCGHVRRRAKRSKLWCSWEKLLR